MKNVVVGFKTLYNGQYLYLWYLAHTPALAFTVPCSSGWNAFSLSVHSLSVDSSVLRAWHGMWWQLSECLLQEWKAAILKWETSESPVEHLKKIWMLSSPPSFISPGVGLQYVQMNVLGTFLTFYYGNSQRHKSTENSKRNPVGNGCQQFTNFISCLPNTSFAGVFFKQKISNIRESRIV